MSNLQPLNTTWSAEIQDIAEAALPKWDVTAGGRHWSPQHMARAWEYYLACLAAGKEAPLGGLYFDVGGAGSPLSWIFAGMLLVPMQIIDPEFNGLSATTFHLVKLYGKVDFISCISVIEHVEEEDEFLKSLVHLLAPGGVLFLTTDYDPSSAPEDTFMFHWMRKRIYTNDSLYLGENSVQARFKRLGLSTFGDTWVEHVPPHLKGLADPPATIPGLGYSFASLCMRKDPQ